MRLLQHTLTFLLLLTTTAASAEQPVSEDHASVHIVFVLPNNMPSQFGNNTPTARVGDIIIPIESVRPISVTIDGEFVGHAMVGYQNVKPVFNLPSGTHEFKFVCHGFKATSIKLKTLGAGSTQYLVVKMEPGSSDTTDEEASDASAATVPGGFPTPLNHRSKAE
tara:strand:- start:180 stop:674 length:495 start_codon:yes stop_codon:yes gene_type:complete